MSWTNEVGRTDRHSKTGVGEPTLEEIGQLLAAAGRGRSSDPEPRQPRRLARRLEPEAVKKLLSDYASKAKGPAVLAAEHGISRGSVRNLLAQNEVPHHRQRLTSEQRLRAVSLYGADRSFASIATELGSSYGAVRRALHAAGVQLRPRGGSKATPRALAPRPPAPVLDPVEQDPR